MLKVFLCHLHLGACFRPGIRLWPLEKPLETISIYAIEISQIEKCKVESGPFLSFRPSSSKTIWMPLMRRTPTKQTTAVRTRTTTTTVRTTSNPRAFHWSGTKSCPSPSHSPPVKDCPSRRVYLGRPKSGTALLFACSADFRLM